jgi:TRAP-type C4-dicarboxylate transport system permease small subunit
MTTRQDSLDTASAPGPGRRLARISEILLGAVAGSLLFAMMTLTFVDVVMRYFFDAPIRGGFEVTEVMMAVLIFAGLPLVSRHGEHVSIDAFDGLIPTALQRPVHVVVQLLCMAVLVGMAWLLMRKAASFAELGDVTQTLKITIAPFVYLMAGLTLATAVVHLIAAFVAPPPRGGPPAVPGDAGVV